MKILLRALAPAAIVLAALAPSPAFALGGGWALPDTGVVLNRPIGAFFEAPMGGYTLYAGQAGSGAASASDYSHINYAQPPAATAQRVLNRLRDLGIPLVAPETQFLGKNPHADSGALIIPRPWVKKDDGEKDKEKDKDKGKGKKKDIDDEQ